ncbi:DUF551 domain-containing protein [Rufibacter latericius]|uniref:DUF551 domain-containing protein n=1 Tax=Rufibacter latericius TaxID=2487040 RepID=A0A3M9MM89_9BACT|nr:DUF551 domain-containing protein [Rufibacter latericius]
MEWIKVTDSLPDHSTVLCCNTNYQHLGYLRQSVWYTTDGDKKVDTANGWGVTHWMPLPDMPKTYDL